MGVLLKTLLLFIKLFHRWPYGPISGPEGFNCFSGGRPYQYIVTFDVPGKGDPYPPHPLDPPMRLVLTLFSR